MMRTENTIGRAASYMILCTRAVVCVSHNEHGWTSKHKKNKNNMTGRPFEKQKYQSRHTNLIRAEIPKILLRVPHVF